MADLLYTYADTERGSIIVVPGCITVGLHGDAITAGLPTGDAAVELVRAMTAAAGLTGHVVIEEALVSRSLRSAEEEGARSMRERVAQIAETPGEWSRLETPADRIRALPLLADAPDADAEPCRSSTADPHDPDVTVWCEHPDGNGHTGDHYAVGAGLTWTSPTGDFLTRLVSELLGEDRQDAADLLAEDPDDTWEKAYAVWSLESAELERYRRGESPVLDRVAQLEKDMGSAEKRIDALELAARESAQSGGAPRATVTGGGYPTPTRYRDATGDLWEDQGDSILRTIAVSPDRPRDLGITLSRAVAERQYGPLTPVGDASDAPCSVCGRAPANQETGPDGTCRHTPATRLGRPRPAEDTDA